MRIRYTGFTPITLSLLPLFSLLLTGCLTTGTTVSPTPYLTVAGEYETLSIAYRAAVPIAQSACLRPGTPGQLSLVDCQTAITVQQNWRVLEPQIESLLVSFHDSQTQPVNLPVLMGQVTTFVNSLVAIVAKVPKTTGEATGAYDGIRSTIQGANS